MSQRAKARAFMQREGHGSELRHVSTRVAPKTNSVANFPDQAVDGAALGNDGLAGGGMIRARRPTVHMPKMITKPAQDATPMGAPGPDPALASPQYAPPLKRGGRC